MLKKAEGKHVKLFLSVAVYFLINSVNAQVTVPLAGNTWSSKAGSNALTNDGLTNWVNAAETFTTYVRVNTPGTFILSVKGKTEAKNETVNIAINGVAKKLEVANMLDKQQQIGTWKIKDTGYIKIILTADKKTAVLPVISVYEISGTSVNAQTKFVKNNEGNFFYWGRRGPSNHLNYVLPNVNTEWFYNELTVPVGNDVVGSYFMANGFADGYFGIQVNAETERRILFSVWSPFQTDDPSKIPDDEKIKLIKKGAGVYTGEFGNEGSGGQSYLRFNWQAGVTYKFLLRAQPVDGNTIYTSYFFDPAANKWMLIASFSRPKKETWLKRLHSFLENFIPEQGDKIRMALYGNQWVCDTAGNWHAVTQAKFSADNTARVGFRMDYAGGVQHNQFYLKNCGFFNHHTIIGELFTVNATGKQPHINFSELK